MNTRRSAAAVTLMVAVVALTTVTVANARAKTAAVVVAPQASASRPSPVTTPKASPSAKQSPSPKPAATHAPAAAHAPSTGQIRALAKTRVDKIIAAQPRGGVSVAAVDLATGAEYHAGATSGMWTASAYKLLVLTALILRDGGVSSGEMATAERAIENSDNVAGYSLFLSAGGNSGVQSALDKLGMTHTVPGNSDPTFTTTSASDYLKLLKALVATGPLSKSSRSLVLDLMRNVEADQRWGVGVVADKGTTFANKNGWLSIDNSNGPGETDDGLWAVTSVGVVTVSHQPVLMAVFTQHQSSFGGGVDLVQQLSRSVVRAVVPSG
jgi:beta-lactamase class A